MAARSKAGRERSKDKKRGKYEVQDDVAGLNRDDTRLMRPILEYPSMGPLLGITHRREVCHTIGGEKRKFSVVVSAAYNAYGLIGPERNGVAVLDEDNKTVLLDRHACQLSGYYGPSLRQIEEWKRVCEMSAESFVRFCDENKERRYQIG